MKWEGRPAQLCIIGAVGAAAVQAAGSWGACPPGISVMLWGTGHSREATQPLCKALGKECQSCGRGDWFAPSHAILAPSEAHS